MHVDSAGVLYLAPSKVGFDLGSDGRPRRSICKGQQRVCNAARTMRIYRPVVAAVKAVWMTAKDEDLGC